MTIYSRKEKKMKKTVFLIVNAQTGDCRIRKSPSAGPIEYVFEIHLEVPDNPVPVVTIKIPIPAAPAVLTEIKEIAFGVPWAISEGIVRVTGLDEKGTVILDYTDEGLERLCEEVGGDKQELRPYDILEYAHKKYGLPFVYLEPARWDKLVGEEEEQETSKGEC